MPSFSAYPVAGRLAAVGAGSPTAMPGPVGRPGCGLAVGTADDGTGVAAGSEGEADGAADTVPAAGDGTPVPGAAPVVAADPHPASANAAITSPAGPAVRRRRARCGTTAVLASMVGFLPRVRHRHPADAAPL
ncbi:hypothetical protein [Kitasatospora sp. NE20-6]|uniref:hypothetical protein n=1 Tax=Kitasatospora sp. NE20-6 TaxID=2859066 RepID=UPI0038B23A90